ncbi:unnamed protein product [Closterium sp. NIES-65]|nr:unnamed protein product [Closterium sp. NIES-65]CAI5960457.1 unnamed protein product [Closterium sp. NIES-65]
MDHSEGETPPPVLPTTNFSYSHTTTETEPYVATDAEDMLDVAISVLDPRLAQQASSSQSTPRSAARYHQVHLSFASPPPDTRKRARCVPPPPTAEELEAQDNAIAKDAEVPPDTEIPEAERSLARRFSTSWKQTYSWLSLKYHKYERQYVGARDFQKSACRNHNQSKVHLAAMEAERLSEGTEVDITEVKNHVDKVKTKLSQYYVEPGASNGPNTSRLNKFLAAHGSKDKRKMELKGVDENGKHAKAEIELHEDIIDPENPGGGCDLEACVDLARRFAQRLIKALGKRMADLRHLDGVGFFSPDKFPDRAGEQDARVKLHLSELLDMSKNKLPGVALANIEPQMRLFTATMEKKFKKQSFHQALTNMLRTAD